MHSLFKTFFSILHVHKIMLERIRRGMLNSIQSKPKYVLKLKKQKRAKILTSLLHT